MQSPHRYDTTRATKAAMNNGILDRRIMRENCEYLGGAVLQILAERSLIAYIKACECSVWNTGVSIV
jgi:hypothetical protein